MNIERSNATLINKDKDSLTLRRQFLLLNKKLKELENRIIKIEHFLTIKYKQ